MITRPGNQDENDTAEEEAPSDEGDRRERLHRILDHDKGGPEEKRGQRDRQAGEGGAAHQGGEG